MVLKITIQREVYMDIYIIRVSLSKPVQLCANCFMVCQSCKIYALDACMHGSTGKYSIAHLILMTGHNI